MAQNDDKEEQTAGVAGDPPTEPQGVKGRGNAPRSALILGLAVLVLPMVLITAYLALMREPAQKRSLLEQTAQSHAEAQARMISTAVASLAERVGSAARSSLALEAVAAQDPAQITALEQALQAYFPEALGLRLIPLSEMGTADLQKGLQGLRNHIEVDLVRRASNDEGGTPEAYEFDGQWIVSLAQVAAHPLQTSRRVVLLVSLDGGALESWLQHDDSPGAFVLEQRVLGNGVDRYLVVASQGAGADPITASADVNGAPWRVLFTPSAATAAAAASSVGTDYDAIALSLLFAVLALVLVQQGISRALHKDVAGVIAGAGKRAQLSVSVPALIPLATELRIWAKGRARDSKPGGMNAMPGNAAPATAPGGSDTLSVEGPATQGLAPHIFRAYDIRGHAESELDDETVFRIGSAIATIAGELGEQTLVIGCDGRTSSARIKAVMEKAMLGAGRDVIDIGLVPTPLLYFATTRLDARSGVMITGSHNGPEVNGMKIVLKGQTIAEGAIDKIRSIAHAGRFSEGTGRVVQQDVTGDYLEEVAGDIAIAVPLKVVVDAGNGATAQIAPALLEEMGCEVIPLFCEIDGTFPNRSPDTSNENNLSALANEVVAQKADFGVAYDGDGDRLAVVTGSGQIIRTDKLMMLFAQDVVARNPGADVVYDVKCSRALAQLITGLGGRPVLWKTGHALMKAKMLETGALLGGEFSGHIFFGERWYGFDDAMYATGRLAEIISAQDRKLDALIGELPNLVSTPEILVPVSDEEKFDLIERFKTGARFADGKHNDLDGLRVDFQDGWGLLRASNTSAALTARFEATSEAGLEAIIDQFRQQLAAVAPDLAIPF